MGSQGSSVSSKKFRFDFLPPHMPPALSPGQWAIETDGIDEFDIVDEGGNIVCSVDGAPMDSDDQMHTNVQCIKLVPELVRAVYTAMRALRGAIPDDETSETVAQHLSELLKRCYSSSEVGGTIAS